MTPPWNGLRAHQDDLLALREIDTPLQTFSERRGLHVVGVPPEPGIAPSAVHRVRARVSQSAQTGDVRVPNSGTPQSGQQEVAAELGVVSRSGNRAYVDDAIHAMRCEQADELVDRPRGMTNRENARR